MLPQGGSNVAHTFLQEVCELKRFIIVMALLVSFSQCPIYTQAIDSTTDSYDSSYVDEAPPLDEDLNKARLRDRILLSASLLGILTAVGVTSKFASEEEIRRDRR